MRVLLIKMSSMGDVIHTLPALTDAMHQIPDIKFTWVVEQGFCEIPAWHPAVEKVITINLRNKNWRQVLDVIKELRQQAFDLVIDAQGLIKSALFGKCCGVKNIAGLAYNSAREPLASFAYQHKFTIDKNLHAIDRLRQLLARALNYSLPLTPAKYNLQIPRMEFNTPYVFFLHGTTWDSKHWPERYWLELADIVTAHGYKVKVTWATAQQKARAQRLADHCPLVQMLPHLTIAEAAQELNNASGVIAVDTGFAHLAAALDTPVVAVYGATDIAKSGVRGLYSTNLKSNFECAPCMSRVCKYDGKSQVTPACMQELSPELVWKSLRQVLTKSVHTTNSDEPVELR